MYNHLIGLLNQETRSSTFRVLRFQVNLKNLQYEKHWIGNKFSFLKFVNLILFAI